MASPLVPTMLASPTGAAPQLTQMQIDQTKDKRNWLIHLLYVRQDFTECLNVIEDQLRACKGACEYAIYVKGLIKRNQGEITESLQLFQTATMLNPHNPSNLKQVARCLYVKLENITRNNNTVI